MKNTSSKLYLLSQKVNRQHLQLILAVVTLMLLVIGAGAPEDGGSIVGT